VVFGSVGAIGHFGLNCGAIGIIAAEKEIHDFPTKLQLCVFGQEI
jgi:hypothetical protein